MRNQIPENLSGKQPTVMKTFSAGFNKFLDKIYHYDFVEHELKETREKYTTADWSKKSPYISRSPPKIPLDAVAIRQELHKPMELSTKNIFRNRLKNYFFPQDNFKLHNSNFFNLAHVIKTEPSKKTDDSTKKKPSRNKAGGKGKSGGGMKMLVLKLMIGLGAVYGSNMLGMWGSIKDSEILMNKVKSYIPESENINKVSPKKGK